MLSGLPEIDVGDWQNNTEYSGCDHNDTLIQVVMYLAQLVLHYIRLKSVAFMGHKHKETVWRVQHKIECPAQRWRNTVF